MKPLTKGEIYNAELFNDEEIDVVTVEDVLSALALTKKKIDEEMYEGFEGIIDTKNVLTIYANLNKILDECFQIKDNCQKDRVTDNNIGQDAKGKDEEPLLASASKLKPKPTSCDGNSSLEASSQVPARQLYIKECRKHIKKVMKNEK